MRKRSTHSPKIEYEVLGERIQFKVDYGLAIFFFLWPHARNKVQWCLLPDLNDWLTFLTFLRFIKEEASRSKSLYTHNCFVFRWYVGKITFSKSRRWWWKSVHRTFTCLHVIANSILNLSSVQTIQLRNEITSRAYLFSASITYEW